MQPIDCIEVYLDASKNAPGIYRIHSVIAYDSKSNEIKNYQELAYDNEFNGSNGNNYEQEIIEYVALRIGVDKDRIVIMGFI